MQDAMCASISKTKLIKYSKMNIFSVFKILPSSDLICFITVYNFCFSVIICVSFVIHLEAVIQRCSVKKVFLEISQNSQESIFFDRTSLVAASASF